MSLKGLGSAVGSVATYLTRVGHVEAMQLVQPVRNGLRWLGEGWRAGRGGGRGRGKGEGDERE